MKKISLTFLTIILTTFCFAQTNKTIEINKLTKKIVDSTFRSFYFISLADAEKIIAKPAQLQDSVCKVTSSVLRYTLNYIAAYKDSTSKGRIFFTYEQYKEDSVATDIYKNIALENKKNKSFQLIKDMGDEAFLVKDDFNYPFIMIRKGKKIFKLKVYYLTTSSSLDELTKVAKRLVSAH